jgi:hypothetical protein
MLDEYKVLNILSIMMAEPKKGSIVGNWSLSGMNKEWLHCS